MKKIIITVLLILGFNAFSQVRVRSNFELAPVIGIANSSYYGDSKIDDTSVTSINMGINADYFLNSNWSIRSGLFLQTMGAEYREFFDYEETLKYITIPLNANRHFGKTRKWNLNFGPSFGFLISADRNGDDIKDKLQSFQLGLNAGLGYKIEISNKFSILVDYQGMSALTSAGQTSFATIKNAYGSLNVGAVFKL